MAISVADIIRAVDEPIRATSCDLADGGCQRLTRCITHDLWVRLGEQIAGYMEGITLGGLIEEHRQGVDSSSGVRIP